MNALLMSSFGHLNYLLLRAVEKKTADTGLEGVLMETVINQGWLNELDFALANDAAAALFKPLVVTELLAGTWLERADFSEALLGFIGDLRGNAQNFYGEALREAQKLRDREREGEAVIVPTIKGLVVVQHADKDTHPSTIEIRLDGDLVALIANDVLDSASDLKIYRKMQDGIVPAGRDTKTA